MREGDRATSQDQSLKWLIEKIYNEGRSQITHGGKLFLLQDLPIPREVADQVAAAALNGYVRCLDLYDGPDDYESFLKKISGLREQIA